jgi:hypothetical protein
VEVSSAALSASVTFICNQWLKLGQLSCELKPAATGRGRTARYRFRVHTGSCKGAGTDASAFFQLFGEDGSETGPVCLEGGLDRLLRGSVDGFEVEEADVGVVDCLRVWHDGKGRTGAWYLDLVELDVVRFGASDVETESHVLLCQAWLSDETGVERTLRPSQRAARVCTYKVEVRAPQIAPVGRHIAATAVVSRRSPGTRFDVDSTRLLAGHDK